ncbi:hypothetical protein GC177_07755 [bacterium]|nr:hypothetical protein [bacterium]
MAVSPHPMPETNHASLSLTHLEKCDLPQGGAVFTLYIPKDAGPNSLGALSRFLEGKGCHLQPEFADNPSEPVLRIGMLEQADKLESWLKDEFPTWQEANLWEHEARLDIPRDLEINPLKTRELEYQREGVTPWGKIRNRFGYKIGPIAGAAFNAGNVMMLVSSLSSGTNGKIDATRMLSALTYIASSAVVIANSAEPAKSRPLDEVVKEAIGNIDDPETRGLLQTKLPNLTPWVEKIQYAVKNNPWEVKALMDSLAGASMFYGALRSGRPVTAMSAALGVAAIGAQLTPPRFRSSIVDIQYIKDKLDDMGVASKWVKLQAEQPIVKGLWGQLQKGFHWLQEHNLAVSGFLGALSSVGYMISGFLGKKSGENSTLSASGLMFLTGNVLQSMTLQKTGFSLGDITFASAHAMQEQNANVDATQDATQERIHGMAMALTNQPEVHQQPAKISRRMVAMMDIMKTEHELSLLKPDGYLTNMNWNEQRKRDFIEHPCTPRTAALEQIAAQQGMAMPMAQ